jgi:hypothetical protein
MGRSSVRVTALYHVGTGETRYRNPARRILMRHLGSPRFGARMSAPPRVVAAVLAILLSSAGCSTFANPAGSAELQGALLDLEEVLGQMREEMALLQWQVDSLQGVVARQDSSLRRLANLLGMPLSP